MDTSVFSGDSYEGLLAFYACIAVLAIPLLAKYLIIQIPAMRHIRRLNLDAAASRGNRLNYPAIQKRSMLWGLFTQLAIFATIIPLSITGESQAWWRIPVDAFVILMVYDFFYYLVHRFLFHDSGFFGGPLKWVHAVHHSQKDPCRKDSNYLHPLETCIGLGLYGATIGLLSALIGDFHFITITFTWIAFSEINQHNHDQMEVDHFPYKYLKYMSFMHHVHHSRFTAGNFATISLLYDWLFGTYDTGNGYKKSVRPNDKTATSQ